MKIAITERLCASLDAEAGAVMLPFRKKKISHSHVLEMYWSCIYIFSMLLCLCSTRYEGVS
jgi:hypothetical protein